MTKKISRLLLIGLITVGACKEVKRENGKNNVKEVVVKSENTIDEKLLIGSWLDQSESKLHFSLLENGNARSDNMKTLLYENWKLNGTKLILTVRSIGNGSSSVEDEVYEINSLTENKMILQNGDYLSEFVKKK